MRFLRSVIALAVGLGLVVDPAFAQLRVLSPDLIDTPQRFDRAHREAMSIFEGQVLAGRAVSSVRERDSRSLVRRRWLTPLRRWMVRPKEGHSTQVKFWRVMGSFSVLMAVGLLIGEQISPSMSWQGQLMVYPLILGSFLMAIISLVAWFISRMARNHLDPLFILIFPRNGPVRIRRKDSPPDREDLTAGQVISLQFPEGVDTPDFLVKALILLDVAHVSLRRQQGWGVWQAKAVAIRDTERWIEPRLHLGMMTLLESMRELLERSMAAPKPPIRDSPRNPSIGGNSLFIPVALLAGLIGLGGGAMGPRLWAQTAVPVEPTAPPAFLGQMIEIGDEVERPQTPGPFTLLGFLSLFGLILPLAALGKGDDHPELVFQWFDKVTGPLENAAKRWEPIWIHSSKAFVGAFRPFLLRLMVASLQFNLSPELAMGARRRRERMMVLSELLVALSDPAGLPPQLWVRKFIFDSTGRMKATLILSSSLGSSRIEMLMRWDPFNPYLEITPWVRENGRHFSGLYSFRFSLDLWDIQLPIKFRVKYLGRTDSGRHPTIYWHPVNAWRADSAVEGFTRWVRQLAEGIYKIGRHSISEPGPHLLARSG